MSIKINLKERHEFIRGLDTSVPPLLCRSISKIYSLFVCLLLGVGGVELAAEGEMLAVITNRKTRRESPTVWMFVVRKPKAGVTPHPVHSRCSQMSHSDGKKDGGSSWRKAIIE